MISFTGPALATTIAALLLVGCNWSEPHADLVICNGAEPESLDPAAVTGQADLRTVGTLFEGLTRFNPRTALHEPALASHWEISSDGLLYHFHLRSNLVWSTGEAITSEDVVYSWRRVVDPKTASDYASQLFFVKNGREISAGQVPPTQLGVQATDPLTVRVELIAPAAFFLDLCASQPLGVVPRQTINAHQDRWLKARPLPVSGPYQLAFWRVHDRIRLQKNPRYWDAAHVSCTTVDLLPVESAHTALNLYERGQADILWDKALIPNELLDVLRARPDCHLFDFLGTVFIRLNTTRAPFNDARVRKALALAIDKERIVEKITRGGERAASHFTPIGTARYQPPEGLQHDPDAARKLLADAGYPGGHGFPTFQYLFNSSRVNEQIAVELQHMWLAELGLKVELRQTEWKVWLNSQTALDYDVCRGSWVGDYNDANTFLDVFSSNNNNNRTGWKNARYDELITAANQSLDASARARLFAEAEKILVREETPVIPIHFYKGMNLYRPEEIDGLYGNILDEHPIWAISKKPKKTEDGRPRS